MSCIGYILRFIVIVGGWWSDFPLLRKIRTPRGTPENPQNARIAHPSTKNPSQRKAKQPKTTMSRSALWRQEANVQDRARHAEETFSRVITEGRDRNAYKKGVLPLFGPDDTFNIHPVLLSSVAKSPYFVNKCCEKLMDWNNVVDEIYYEVKHLEPWTAGK